VNGGTAAEVPGTWSASVEWLVHGLAGRLPSLRFLEVRYRIKSWRRLELCAEDGRAAVDAAVRPPKLDYQRFKLPNGLTVLLHQDRSTPIAHVQLW